MKSFESTYIEITNICNLSCDFCPKTGRAPVFMKTDLFEKILMEIRGRTRFIFFHVMGEPLMHPDLEQFLELSFRYNQQVNITTNGTLISKAAPVLLGSAALRQVNFSLHSLNNQNESYVRDYMKEIFSFIRKSQLERTVYITLRLWNMDNAGRNSSNRFITEAIEKEFNLNYSIIEKDATYKGIKLAKNIFLNQDTAFLWPNMEQGFTGSRDFCSALRDQAALLVDGTVVPCCLDCNGTIALGNIRENSFDEILQSKRARALYEGFSRREAVEELCKHCGFQSLFKD
ncbi:MAG: radical SAM protein [bacterium]|nr:radical SAM protein [bacterium]